MGAKILIADDDVDNRTIAREILEASGFDVVEAVDGLDALEKVALHAPDVLLLDLSMPRMTGWEVAKRLRLDGRHDAMPIVAFTAHAIVGDELKARAAGCDDYISKPCIPSDVVVKIRKWAEKVHG